MKLLIGNFIFIKCKLILQSRSVIYKDSIWACIEGYASVNKRTGPQLAIRKYSSDWGVGDASEAAQALLGLKAKYGNYNLIHQSY